MLHVRNISASYGGGLILFDISLDVGPREVVTLIGRNGMGKSTTIRSIMGLTPPKSGEIVFDDRRIDAMRPHQVAQLGIGLVPEGRQIFVRLSVEENLVATSRSGSGRAAGWSLERVYALFPRLAERRRQSGGTLSGGEQQMLAIGRALMTNPRLLILDEATEGLAPLIREDIWRCLGELKAEGLSILLVDRNLDALIGLADRHYVVEKGRISWSGTSRDLALRRDTIEQKIGI
jgi:branched-chain amino acid transport system ATP-binding protein